MKKNWFLENLDKIALAYAIIGLILFFYGKKIVVFSNNMNNLQNLGLGLLLLVIAMLLIRLSLKKKKTIPILLDILVCLVLLIDYFTLIKIIPFNNTIYQSILILANAAILIPLSLLTSELILNLYRKFNNSIAEPTQKLTILIALLAAVVSLLAIMK